MGDNTENGDGLGKKKVIWVILFVIIAAATIWAVFNNSKDFSFQLIKEYFHKINPLWYVLAGCGVIGFIFFEALAIKIMGKSYGYKIRMRNALAYSSGDIYFSAITPSATGGQPVCGYFMIKDGLPLSFSTMALLLNLMMYTASLTILGALTIAVYPSVFLKFNGFSKTLIIIGACIQIVLITMFMLLLTKEKVVEKLTNGIIKFFAKIHLVKNPKETIEKRKKSIDSYKECIGHLKEDRSLLLKVFLCNIGQRLSQMLIPSIIIFGSDKKIKTAIIVLFVQILVTLGSYVIPIPGAMGVTDYLMIDGFNGVVAASTATNLEIISRGISFYICIAFCGLLTLLKYYRIKKRS